MADHLDDELFREIGTKLNIGYEPDDYDWYFRVAYSASCMNAYASLWDADESVDQLSVGHWVSVQHFKSRFIKTMTALNLISEYKSAGRENTELWISNLANEFFDEVVSTGNVYHKSYYISSAAKSVNEIGGLSFIRGEQPGSPRMISGGGIYGTVDQHIKPSADNYMLEKRLLTEWLKPVIEACRWSSDPGGEYTEYLNISGKGTEVWINQDRNPRNTVYLIRRGEPGRRLYYFCKKDAAGKPWISPLPQWMLAATGNNWMPVNKVKNAILMKNDCLPEIIVFRRGSIVKIKQYCLMGEHEQKFINLYSWPGRRNDNTTDYTARMMKAEVFDAIKGTFKTMGYHFVEKKQ